MEKIIAVCGAGGKTSRIFSRKDLLVSSGKTVIIITTTKMMWESFAVDAADPSWVALASELLQTKHWCIIGHRRLDVSGVEKMYPLSPSEYEMICSMADIVLIEADGSRHHSVKVPDDTDIVFAPGVTDIEIIMGLWEVGKPAREIVHRSELLEGLGFDPASPVTLNMIDTIVREKYMPRCQNVVPLSHIQVYYSIYDQNRITFIKQNAENDDELFSDSFFPIGF